MRNASRVLMLIVAMQATEAQPRWTLAVEQRFVVDEGPTDPIKDLRDFAVGVDGRVYVLENTVKQVHGRFRATATLAGRPSAHATLRVQRNQVYAVVLDDDDIPSIVRARIVTGAR